MWSSGQGQTFPPLDRGLASYNTGVASVGVLYWETVVCDQFEFEQTSEEKANLR